MSALESHCLFCPCFFSLLTLSSFYWLSLFLTVTIFLIAHRLFWPISLRLLYACKRNQILKEGRVLLYAGALLLIVGFGRYEWLHELFVGIFEWIKTQLWNEKQTRRECQILRLAGNLKPSSASTFLLINLWRYCDGNLDNSIRIAWCCIQNRIKPLKTVCGCNLLVLFKLLLNAGSGS